MKVLFKLKAETKTCYRFENQEGGKDTQQTLYLKKETLKNAGLDPAKGLTVVLEAGNE